MNVNCWNHRMRDVIGTLLIVIVISITVLSKGIVLTLPITMFLAIGLFFIDYKMLWIFITAFVVHVILGIADNKWISILAFIDNIINLCSGYLLALCIKKLIVDFKQTKNVILSILSFGLVWFAFGCHKQSYGTPLGYLDAKKNVMNYINETYNGDLEIKDIRYNSKMLAYMVNVTSKKDSRDEGMVSYSKNSGYIGDDYHFRIECRQSEMIEEMLKVILKQKTDIAVDKMSLSVSVSLPHNKYSKRDIYSGQDPLEIRFNIKANGTVSYYDSKETFGKEAFKIIEILKELNFSYKDIEIDSFLADGNTKYSILLKSPIEVDNVEDTIPLIKTIGSNK